MERAAELIPRVDPSVGGLLRIAVVVAEGVRVGEAPPPLVAAIEARAADFAEAHRGRTPGQIEGLRSARELYRAFGIDPTRNRPSSEALLRRALRGRPLPRVNNAVDVGNLCSMSFMLPLGLYDADRLRPPLSLRRGREGEGYAGIRKDRVSVEGRPALVDAEGPFGNPTSDSLRASVTEEATRLLMVVFAPAGYPQARLVEHARTADQLFRRFLGDPRVEWTVPEGPGQ